MNARILLPAVLFAATAVAQTSTPRPADLPDAPSAAAQVKPAPVPTGPTVVFDTTMGRMVCKLFSAESPLAVQNFISLAEGTKTWTDPITKRPVAHTPFFNGTTFHRVIPNFMIQGGDRVGDGTGDAGYYFDNENTPGLIFDQPGRLAMANAGLNTNGTQFFITEQAVPQLDGKYTIFGQCDEHAALLVASITRVDRDANDKPRTPVILNKVSILREGQPLPPIPPGPQNIVPEGQPPVSMPKGPPPQ